MTNMELLKREVDNDRNSKRKKLAAVKKAMNKLTQEKLEAALEKKKQCNAKAMIIVERLIEPNVEETWLLENLFLINQSHYLDVVEERAIIKYCGYPLCDSVLEDVPAKQFYISTKQNKVFDITDRKKYCSNLCYKASVHLKDQLYTSPLWLRDCEDVVEYKLYSSGNKTGSTGMEIDLGNVNPLKSEDVEAKNKLDDNAITNATQFSNKNVMTENKLKKISFSREHTIKSIADEDSSKKSEKISIGENKYCASAINECVLESEVIRCESEENQNQEHKSSSNQELKVSNKLGKRGFTGGDKVDLLLDSWFTVDSLLFLYGEDKMKEIFQDFGTPVERFGQLINTKDAYLYERYSEICRRLNFIELKEKLEEREELLPTKPIPDFEALKTEARKLELKVKSFYKGDKQVSFPEVSGENDVPNNNSTPVLPLIDKHCVSATRRRIVLDKLFKTLPDIQSALGLAQFNIRHEIQEFVHTLALTASNITMSPSEWNLMSIVIIKLFTVRNELLCYAFQSDFTQRRIINLLLSYKLEIDFLQKCILKLTYIDTIIKNSK